MVTGEFAVGYYCWVTKSPAVSLLHDAGQSPNEAIAAERNSSSMLEKF